MDKGSRGVGVGPVEGARVLAVGADLKWMMKIDPGKGEGMGRVREMLTAENTGSTGGVDDSVAVAMAPGTPKGEPQLLERIVPN